MNHAPPSPCPVSYTDWDKQVYIPEPALEVVPRSLKPYDGLEYNPNSYKPYGGLQYNINSPDGYGIEFSPTSPTGQGIERNNPPLVDEKIATPTSNPRRKKIWGMRRKFFFLLLAAIAVIIVAAAVGGAIGATQGNKSSTSSSSSGTGPQASGTDSLNSASNSTSSTTPTTKGIRTNSTLASIAYNDSSTGMLQYRLYYQDENNMIKESAWNETGQQWYVSHDGIAKAMPGTPIAAAVRESPFDFQTNVFFLSPFKPPIIREQTTSDGTSWSPGPLSQSDTVTPSPSTPLTATWHSHNPQDPNTLLLIYQDGASTLHLLNRTDADTSYTATPLTANASPSTSLSVVLSWNGVYQSGLRLYYQIAPSQPNAGKLAALYWRSEEEYSAGTVFAQLPAPPTTANGWQNRESLPLPGPAIPRVAPIAAFSRGTTLPGNSTPYQPQQIQILSSTSTGDVTAITWLGRYGGSWFSAHTPTLLGTEIGCTPLAANGDGAIFTIGDRGGRIRCFKAHHDGLSYEFQEYVL